MLNDMSYVPYLRLAGLIFLSYSFYGVIRGYVNGMRQFFLQAALEVIYNTLKLVLVVGLAWLSFSVMGAIGGFAIAVFLLAIISLFAVGFHKVKGSVSFKALMHFNLIVMGIAFLENLLLQLDLFAVKALTPAAVSNLLGGHYTAVLSIARLPYYAVLAMSFVIFPLISHSTFIKDRERTARYIKGVMRYSLIILMALAVLFSAEAKNLLSLLYGAEYTAGAPALSIAVFGLLAYGLLYIAITIITASGRVRFAFYMILAVLAVDVVANIILVPRFLLVGAATASAIAFFLSVILSGIYLQKRFGAFIPLMSILRVCGAGLIVYLISTKVPLAFPWWVVKMGVLALVYGGILILTREFGREDFKRVLRVVKG